MSKTQAPDPVDRDEVARLARVAIAESEGALMVCGWMEAALKVCRVVAAIPAPEGECGFAPLSEIAACPHCGGAIDAPAPAEGAASLPSDADIEWPDIDDLAHSAAQEAYSFGISHDLFKRWMASVMFKTTTAIRAAIIAAQEATNTQPKGMELPANIAQWIVTETRGQGEDGRYRYTDAEMRRMRDAGTLPRADAWLVYCDGEPGVPAQLRKHFDWCGFHTPVWMPLVYMHSVPPQYRAAQAIAPAPGAATAWAEGYRQGVLDERTSAENVGIAGFGAKVEPARQNPYRDTQAPAPAHKAEELVAFEEWRNTLHAANLDGKRDLVWRHIAGAGFEAGAAWARSQAPAVAHAEPDHDAWKCDRCNGDGWHWEMAQVGERKSDQQELKTECRECGGIGWCGPDAQAAASHAKEKTNA